MMDFVKINGKVWDVAVTEIEESFNILYTENTGRTIAGRARMVLDPIGTFIGHKVTFRRRTGKEVEYDKLFDLLATPRYDGIPVEIVHNQTVIKYEAYVSNGSRLIEKISRDGNRVYWGEFSANLIPMEAQVIPN